MSETVQFIFHGDYRVGEDGETISLERHLENQDALLAGDIAESFYNFLVASGWSHSYRLRLTSGTKSLYDSDPDDAHHGN